jgi:hypothetical protein
VVGLGVVAGLEVVGGLVRGGAGRVVGADRVTGVEVRGTFLTVVGAAAAPTVPALPAARGTIKIAATAAASPTRRPMFRSVGREAEPVL